MLNVTNCWFSWATYDFSWFTVYEIDFSIDHVIDLHSLISWSIIKSIMKSITKIDLFVIDCVIDSKNRSWNRFYNWIRIMWYTMLVMCTMIHYRFHTNMAQSSSPSRGQPEQGQGCEAFYDLAHGILTFNYVIDWTFDYVIDCTVLKKSISYTVNQEKNQFHARLMKTKNVVAIGVP